MAKPQPKVISIPLELELANRDLQEAAADAAEGLAAGTPVPWFRPTIWSGDLADPESITKAFDRARVNDAMVKAISDNGNTGDLVCGSLMIDALADFEAAFRARFDMQGVRAAAFRANSAAADALNKGEPLQATEYLRRLLAVSRSAE